MNHNAGMASSPKRYVAEFVGTSILVTAIVGSGAMAASRTSDAGIFLLTNAAVTAITLWILIVLLSDISGAHFNPAVSAVMLYRKALNIRDFFGYVFSQVSGAVVGVVVANLMYDLPTLTVSETERVTTAHLLSEVVATAGLVGLIVALIMTTNTKAIPAAVSGWVFAAILFTSSTAFANPAVTIGRSLTSSVTGIAPASAVAFILVQFVGAVIGLIVSEVFLAKEKS
ncbi:MAG: hypothetical protein RIS43_547 [Actinomycetota bacterium]